MKLKVRLGRRLIKAETDSRKCLELFLDTSEKLLLPDADKAQAAAELLAGIFGVERLQELLDFYGGAGMEKQLSLLLCRVLRKAARAELKRQKRRAESY